MKTHRLLSISIVVLVAVLSFTLAACKGETPASPAPTEPAVTTPAEAPAATAHIAETAVPVAPAHVEPSATVGAPGADVPLSSGAELFVAKGCAACHGDNAEGTVIAPALTGHTAIQVRRQVRAPVGLMPLFPPDKLSDSEVAALAEFVTGLEGGHAHVKKAGGEDDLVLHHWMALFSVEDNELTEAGHHVEHIIDLTEGEHKSRMKATLGLVQEGDTHEAAHILEQMLAGLSTHDMDEAAMHLKMALSSVRIQDAPSALHHLGHFALATTGDLHEAGLEIASFIRRGELPDAEHEIEQVLTGDLGVDLDEGMDMDMDAHDDGDDHDADAHDDMDMDAHDDGDGDADAHDAADAHVDGDEHDADTHDEDEHSSSE